MKFKIKVNVGDFAPTSRTMTDKGLLCKDAVLAIAPQVRDYTANELGITGWKGGMVKMYTPAEALFSDEVMNNLNGADFTESHPNGNKVTPSNWRKHSIGTATNIRRDGNKLIGDLLVKDDRAIKTIQSNKKVELSLGYDLEAELSAGKAEDGSNYDVIVTKMIGDHVALVKQGRGGRSVRIGDKQSEKKMTKIKLANGMTFEVEGENLEALLQGLDAQNAEFDKLKSQADGEVTIGEQVFKLSDTVAIQAAFDAIAADKLAAESKATELAANSIKPEDVERLAAERSETVTNAKTLKSDIDDKGKSVEDIKSEVVTAHAGDTAVMAVLKNLSVGDAAPELIDTAFRVLLATKATTSTTQIKTQTGDNAAAAVLNQISKPASVSATDLINQAKSNMYKSGE